MSAAPALKYPDVAQPPPGVPPAAAGGFARAFKRGAGVGNVQVKFGALGRTISVGSVEAPGAPALGPVWYALGAAGVAASAYHGYKRNNSVGWAVVWGLLGGIAPFITVPVAFAQGFGKRR